MDIQLIELPLIQDVIAHKDYRFNNIEAPLIDLLMAAAELKTPNRPTQGPLVFKLLECFLQITGKSLTLKGIQKPEFAITCREFFGAIHSLKFWNVVPRRKGDCCICFIHYVNVLRKQYPKIPKIDMRFSHSRATPARLVECVRLFDSLPWIEEKAYIWHGWKVVSLNERCSYLQLLPVYERLGKDFVDKLYQAYKTYMSTRRTQSAVGANVLARFIGIYEDSLTPEHFTSSAFTSVFWRKFAIFYVSESLKNGGNALNSISAWHKNFIFFVKNYLEPTGLFAPPFGEFPSPPRRHPKAHETSIRQDSDGTHVRIALLTPIPLTVTDAEALKILFYRIEKDLNTLLFWARSAILNMWGRYQNRKKLAALGTSRKIASKHCLSEDAWLSHPDNPQSLMNSCATFEEYGFLHSSDINHRERLYSLPGFEMASAFALPTTGALLPHCAVLVASHPQITPSFLENLKLYSPTGIQTGFQKTNGTAYLISEKPRIPSLASKEQRVQLNAETTKIVEQIIELTTPLRNYLKKKKVPDWRHLILSCGQGFSFPKRCKSLGSYTSDHRYVTKNAREIEKATGISAEEANSLAEHFNLPALRSSAGTLVFLKTGDSAKMAEALGHSKLSLNTLDHYLPRPIRDFFQERWIRIFQQSLVVEALKDSKHVLTATKFKDMDELNEFMSIHALKRLPNNGMKAPKKTDPIDELNEVTISVSTEILSVLLSLQIAVDQSKGAAPPLAVYWAEISRRVAAYIESTECRRSDLKSYLSDARIFADPTIFSTFVYG